MWRLSTAIDDHDVQPVADHTTGTITMARPHTT